ncbi:MAG: RND family transporter [Cryomorphaceae bacterium]|nr:MAG: RND family transporter [Cryomorphaceae bacterium]
MWHFLSGAILRYRIPILISVGLMTIFMGFMASKVDMEYRPANLLPSDDSTNVHYDRFRSLFSEDGNLIVLGVKGEEFYEQPNFAAWYRLGNDLRKLEGVDSVFSVAHLYNLQRNTELKRFDLVRVVKREPTTQSEVDSLRAVIESLPFYEGLLFNRETHAQLMMVFVDADKFNSKDRGDVIENITDLGQQFTREHMEVFYSGLPFIRTTISERVKGEMGKFVLLAAGVAATLLFLFFRSLKVVVVCLTVVIIGVIWSIGTISLFDYRINILMALIPPLIIVIGVPNGVFLLNKYHHEFKNHGNQIKALTRVIHKVGNATFMTNATTALGFATFIFTQSDMLKQFGVVASISIMGLFVLSILIIPGVFSFLPKPQERHTRHLDRQWLYYTVDRLVVWVTGHRTKVYIITVVLFVVGVYGITLIRATGNIVDDLPKDDPVLTDLKFMEDNFNGVMPFEIMIDTRKPGAITQPNTLKKIDQLQTVLSEHDELSKSLSIADALKFAKQGFYNGNPARYSLMNNNERSFIAPYLTGYEEGADIARLFVDSTRSVTRVTAQMADIGTTQMDDLIAELRPRIDSVFAGSGFDIMLTGTSVVFLKGTNYLVKNLFISLFLAILVIATVMSLLFRSWRMVIVSLVPNLFPLIITAAIMGYAGIPIKPSTILVFSIAFGISVDDTIHFLAKYRQELRLREWDIRTSVIRSVRETGVSMIYTSIVLFFGFGMFALSNFDGTVALGVLVSVTLLIAMLANLVLLPSLLLTLERSITTKSFNEPLLEIIDEEEDIELNELVVRRLDESGRDIEESENNNPS